ncbi:MAG: hypothetical protein LAC69_03980 [Chlorobium sp.]|nr:hypothetical protein [Chlorobium sp.]
MRSSPKLTFIAIELSSLTCFSMTPKLKRDVHPFCTNRATLHEKILAIVAGSRNRNRTIADSSDLDHTIAAELLFLIETLETHGL